jgi:hypothetical protein
VTRRRGLRRGNEPVVRFDVGLTEEQIVKALLEAEYVLEVPAKELARVMGIEPVRVTIWRDTFRARGYNGSVQDDWRMRFLLEYCRRTGADAGDVSELYGWRRWRLKRWADNYLERRRIRIEGEKPRDRRGRRPKYLPRHKREPPRPSKPVPRGF